ncbi:MAG: hypothetical protein WBL50_04955 [Candidatus Acidiferrum sp.]
MSEHTISLSDTKVWGSEYPRVAAETRVHISIKAPDATKIKLNSWSGPKMDMVTQPNGYWITRGAAI